VGASDVVEDPGTFIGVGERDRGVGGLLEMMADARDVILRPGMSPWAPSRPASISSYAPIAGSPSSSSSSFSSPEGVYSNTAEHSQCAPSSRLSFWAHLVGIEVCINHQLCIHGV
jgi:hypothetical protein